MISFFEKIKQCQLLKELLSGENSENGIDLRISEVAKWQFYFMITMSYTIGGVTFWIQLKLKS
jgi:hypothetical protein